MRFNRIIVAFLLMALLAGSGLFAQRRGALTPEQPPQNFVLTVTANVPGASLTIDNVGYKGSQAQLPAGPHTIVVRCQGYQDFMTTVQLSGDQTVYANLVPLLFSLSVRTNVPGALVSLGNGQSGQSGQVFRLPGGGYQISVSAPGYLPFSTSVQLGADQTLNVTLAPATYTLTVNSSVPGAALYIDNVGYKGRQAQLPAGPHTIVVRCQGYQDFMTTVQLGGDQTINAVLNPLTFNLTVNSNVVNAQVVLGTGQTGQAGQVFSLPGGSYQVTVSAPGYHPFTTVVQLGGDQLVRAELAPLTGTVVFDLPRGTALQFFVDDRLVNPGKGPATMELTAGQHRLRVEIGFMSAETLVTVVAGQTLSVAPQLSLIVK